MTLKALCKKCQEVRTDSPTGICRECLRFYN
jgi:hypothetical protein